MTHKKTDEGYPIFRSYLETENDKPYYSMNTLSFYYEDMERKQKLIEDLAKAIAGYDQTLTGNLQAIEQQVAERFEQWDEKLKTFDGSVMDLLQEWVDDGTMDHIVDTSLIDQKIAPLTAQLADKVGREELENVKSGTPKGVYPTLLELETAFPLGNDNIYIVSANANWYFWNGSKWESGGVYQAATSEFRNLLAKSNVPTSLNASSGARIQIKPDGTWATFGSYSASYQNPLLKNGHKYYAKMELKPESIGGLANTIRLTYSDGTNTQIANQNNSRLKATAIITADKTLPGNMTVGVTTAGTVERKNQMLVNLSELFGVGNEPTIEEFEKLLAIFPDEWFDSVNSFENMQKHILRSFVKSPNSTGGSQQFIGDDGKTYNYNLKPKDGFVVFEYSEVQ